MATSNLPAAECLSESGLSRDQKANELASVEVQPANAADEQFRFGSPLIIPYLLENCAEFRRLSELRQIGWENPAGDLFFQKQRNNADKASDKNAEYFFGLMQRIGQELHRDCRAFTIQQRSSSPLRILDMCMAPGGFLMKALEKNTGSHCLAFSLPVSDGGHKVLLPASADVEQRLLDIAMLAADMGVRDIPEEHPDAANFLPQQLKPDQLFDLVVCDGQVLRTHTRATYREKREAWRLTITQLALGLEHLAPGGKMIILLHKVEAWGTVDLLWTFAQFSSIRLFKPKQGHAKRSSFYLIASNIQSQHPEAIRAVEGWKESWKYATLRTDEEYHEFVKAYAKEKPSAEQVLEEFGPRLVELGRNVWKVQADALAKAPFIREAKGGD